MNNGWVTITINNVILLIHYVNGKSHNEKCPAIIHDIGTKYWKQNDKVHRLDGPAREGFEGKKYWYYQGKEIDCNSQKEFDRIIKLKSLW